VRRLIDLSYSTAKVILTDHVTLLHALAERLLEQEIVDGAEVAAMVSAFQEGRPMPAYTPAVNSGTPSGGAPVTKEKPKVKEEEEAPGPGLISPKPSLA